jgi:DNA-binding response OmpR family regulator
MRSLNGLAPAGAAASDGGKEARTMVQARRILIVEDEPNVRLVFRTALESVDYLLSTAADGETALRWLKKEPFDLVLLDLRMPGMGGMELLRRLRGEGIEVPVVIVSAHDCVPNVVQAMRLGAIDFLPKPLTPDVLRKVVSEVLARHAPRPRGAGATRDVTPGDEPSDDLLVQAKQALNRREFGEAEESLRRAIATEHHAAEAHYLMGVLHEMRDDRHAAYAAYRAALQADPRFEPARIHLMKFFSDRMM